MFNLKMAFGLPKIQEQNNIYESCHLEKQTISVFLDKTCRALIKLHLVHTHMFDLMQMNL